MSFWSLDTLELKEFRHGIMSAAEAGENLIMVYMELAEKMEDTGHEHAFDQCGIILQGKIEMSIGEERRTLNPNETYFIPSGTHHGWKTFDSPVRLLDVSLKQS